jgi:hypothetical protein
MRGSEATPLKEQEKRQRVTCINNKKTGREYLKKG